MLYLNTQIEILIYYSVYLLILYNEYVVTVDASRGHGRRRRRPAEAEASQGVSEAAILCERHRYLSSYGTSVCIIHKQFL